MDGAGDDAVANFAEVAGCDDATARFFLEANAGNVAKALEMFHEQMQVQHRHQVPARPAPAPPSPRQPPRPPHGAGERPAAPIAQPRRGFLARLARIPVGVLRATFTLAFRTLGLGLEFVSFLGRRLLPAPLFRALTRSMDAMARSSEILDPTVAAEQFSAKFKEVYGEQCPVWQECPWQEAANRAHREFKFLLVYIHAPEHPATADFCRDTLCSTEIVEFMSEQVVAWGGDVRFSDAFALASSLRATTYPFVGLLLGSSSRLRLVFTQGGACSPEVLRAGLQAAIDEHGAELVVERAEAQEREFNRMLREQQDREYQESLEQDRQREAALEEQRKVEEEAARAQAEEEARIRAEMEAEERKREEFRLALKARREKALDVVTEEPESAEPGACPIRIRMPNGSNKQRRFLSSDKVQAIYNFINTDEEFEILSYNLVTNFPHCVYDADKAKMTIEEAGLAGAMLLVQSLDD